MKQLLVALVNMIETLDQSPQIYRKEGNFVISIETTDQQAKTCCVSVVWGGYSGQILC
jgi:hypothetical protein